MSPRRLHRPSPILALLAAVALPAALVLPTAGGIRVVDGDTVDLGYRVVLIPNRYRLAGFDAPEIKQAGCASELAAGMRAKDAFLQALDGSDVTLRYLGSREKWKRLLGALRVNGEDIAQRAAREGWGRPYDGGRREGWCAIAARVVATQMDLSTEPVFPLWENLAFSMISSEGLLALPPDPSHREHNALHSEPLCLHACQRNNGSA